MMSSDSQALSRAGGRPFLWVTRVACALLALLVVVALLLMGFLVVRSKVFTGGPPDDAFYKALWTFIASALATSATLVGLLFGKAQNDRTLAFQRDVEARNNVAKDAAESRQTLDTVVDCLELLTVSDGTYAPKARVAGSLAALIHLGHPVIAMRTLSAAWTDEKVDPETAVWLIGEVLRSASTEPSKKEAAGLLLAHADELCLRGSEHRGEFVWPDVLWAGWRKDFPRDARFDILFAAVSVLLSRPKEAWWGPRDGWVAVLLHGALVDQDESVRDSACQLLKAFVIGYQPQGANWPSGDGFTTPAKVEEAVRKYEQTWHGNNEKWRSTLRANHLARRVSAWRAEPANHTVKLWEAAPQPVPPDPQPGPLPPINGTQGVRRVMDPLQNAGKKGPNGVGMRPDVKELWDTPSVRRMWDYLTRNASDLPNDPHYNGFKRVLPDGTKIGLRATRYGCASTVDVWFRASSHY